MHHSPELWIVRIITDMDETLQKTLLVWAAFAIVFGPLLTRSSLRRQPIHGGILAQFFHFLGATALVAVIPTIIAALIFGGGFRLAFPLAVSLVLTSLFCMILFAIVERPALRAYESQREDLGWTEKDARTSGL